MGQEPTPCPLPVCLPLLSLTGHPLFLLHPLFSKYKMREGGRIETLAPRLIRLLLSPAFPLTDVADC